MFEGKATTWTSALSRAPFSPYGFTARCSSSTVAYCSRTSFRHPPPATNNPPPASYPLQFFPAIEVIEGHLFAHAESSKYAPVNLPERSNSESGAKASPTTDSKDVAVKEDAQMLPGGASDAAESDRAAPYDMRPFGSSAPEPSPERDFATPGAPLQVEDDEAGNSSSRELEQLAPLSASLPMTERIRSFCQGRPVLCATLLRCAVVRPEPPWRISCPSTADARPRLSPSETATVHLTRPSPNPSCDGPSGHEHLLDGRPSPQPVGSGRALRKLQRPHVGADPAPYDCLSTWLGPQMAAERPHHHGDLFSLLGVDRCRQRSIRYRGGLRQRCFGRLRRWPRLEARPRLRRAGWG